MPTRTLHFPSARHLSRLYAGRTDNLAHAEHALGVTLVTREDWLRVEATTDDAIARVEQLFHFLNEASARGMQVRSPDFTRFVDLIARDGGEPLRELFARPLVVSTHRKSIVPKTLGQKLYLQSILRQPLTFGIGPAGTGKTYLAMAAAVSALIKGEVERIVLTRPAVEAGEALGFLPGDLREKILPYLRPLYDAMHDMLDISEVEKLTEKGVLEIAPLAYMRGRTLPHSFVILDEAQNTTPEQMMMFLTRLGEESRMVVTGDITQIDLPRARQSGLVEIESILRDLPEIAFHHFSGADVVRHPLVHKIIDAYERYKNPITDETDEADEMDETDETDDKNNPQEPACRIPSRFSVT